MFALLCTCASAATRDNARNRMNRTSTRLSHRVVFRCLINGAGESARERTGFLHEAKMVARLPSRDTVADSSYNVFEVINNLAARFTDMLLCGLIPCEMTSDARDRFSVHPRAATYGRTGNKSMDASRDSYEKNRGGLQCRIWYKVILTTPEKSAPQICYVLV